MSNVWWSEDNYRESVLSSTTQVVRFGGRSLFLLSHLTNPRTVVLNWGDSDIHRGTR